MATTTLPRKSPRSAGVLLHISSLPNNYAIGNLGQSAYDFVDLLAAAKQSWWQMLPVNPIGAGNSPYSTICCFAGEPMLICPDLLVERKLLKSKDLPAKNKANATKTNYLKAKKDIDLLLQKAFLNFDLKDRQFLNFCKQESKWLDNYAHFCCLSKQFKTKNWYLWPKELRTRNPQALAASRALHATSLLFHKFVQFCFHEQWQSLKAYANKNGVGLIGDIPIFVSYESSDVWANQQFFALAKDGKQSFVAGVPPDYFNANGQRWGNALYRWDVLKKNKFSWWIDRFKQMTVLFDLVRIDHFIGFHRYWEIPAKAKSAKTGKWKLAEGDALFAETKKKLGGLPFIAEDLGLVTPEVHALREKYNMPSMKILQFGFTNDSGKSAHLPCNFSKDCVVYTGTHDNDTTVGWYRYAKKTAKNRKPPFDLKAIDAYFLNQTKSIHWSMIAETYKSVAAMAIAPMQDVVGLGSAARMNLPGKETNQWAWRITNQELKKINVAKWAELCRATGRS